jgi:hypothetical protein
MAQRVIQSPGVQISEVDLSLRAPTIDTTTVLVAGFSPKGPTSEPIAVSTLSEYEQIFGTPTNGAERYFYYTVKAAFQSPASITVARLPYGYGLGAGYGSQYTALVYPVLGKKYNANDPVYNLNDLIDSGDMVLLGKPSLVILTDNEYNSIINGTGITWSNQVGQATFSTLSQFASAGLIVLNKSKVVTNSRFEGYYVGLIDNTTVNPQVDFRGINSALTVATTGSKLPSQFTTISEQRLNFALSATFDGVDGSISQAMENVGDTTTIGTSAFRDSLQLGVFKLRQSTLADDVLQLNYVLEEGYRGSIDFYRQVEDPNGGPALNYFLGNQEDTSQNVVVMVNPYISNEFNSISLVDQDGIPKRAVRVISDGLKYAAGLDSNFTGINAATVTSFEGLIGNAGSIVPLGTYNVDNPYTKVIGNVPGKLNRLFDKLDNYDVYPLTLTVEGGLGTIFASACATNGNVFDDTKYITAINGLSSSDGAFTSDTNDYRADYTSVFNEFNSFAESRRKDHLFIADAPIGIFIQGQILKTLDRSDTNFTQNIYWPLRNVYDVLNTSYACVYGTCVNVTDIFSDKRVWIPFSGYAAAIMGNTDANYQPWYAPAGFTRGIIAGVNDIGLYPKQKQRDQLYKISINPVAFFPTDGFVVYGQKTLAKRPTTFDRINVRRLFINLETLVRNTVKFFVFEPNTLFTRTQVINTLSPFFENAKNTQGLYDYLIICDEKNNTPTVIDNNELVVDIYLKPTRTSEFILVNFYATRTGQDFNEIVS